MMSKWQKYPAYKDSGIEWIGRIPKEWEVLPTKRFHKITKEINSRKICNNVLSLTLRGVVNNNINSPEGLVPKDYATYQIFEKDNLVFKLIDLENISTSRVGIVHEKGIMSSAYIRLEVGNNSFPRYAYYYFYNLYLNQVYNNLGSGVRSTLTPTDLLNIFFIKPPKQEQIKIASYLDKKTSQIDKAIRQKEKLIKLLKEYRQIIINEAVTKGVDENGKVRVDNGDFKDSGIEWIGRIPKHWEVRKITHIFNKIGSGTTPTSTNMQYYDGDINWLQTGDLTDDIIYKTSKKITIKAFKDFSTLKLYPKNSLVIAMYGATIGKVGILNIETTTNQACCVLFNTKIVLEKFAFYWFMASKNNIISMAYGGGQPNISQDLIKSLKMPIPPKKEQEKIVKYIDEKTTKIDKALHLQQNYIEKLKEYKATLIDSVVTGKVRVV